MTSVNQGKGSIHSTPSNEDVVYLLCKFLRNETRTVRDAKCVSKLVKHIVLECPNPYCRNEKKEISFQKGKGYTNPFNHLKACVCHGKISDLYKVYKENQERKARSMQSYFTPVVKVSAKIKAVSEWIILIIEESLPVSVI